MGGRNLIGLWIVGGAAVITVALIVTIVLIERNSRSVDAGAYDAIPAAWINGTELGSPEAPVVLQAFEDFLCPHCGQFNAAAKDKLVEEFIVPGRVRFVYEFFPLQIFEPESLAAARAGLCISELANQFWLYHDELFFGERGANRYSMSSLTEMARTLDVPENDFVECMGSTDTQTRISASIQNGETMGVTGTPSLFINGQQYEGSAVDYDAIKAALNAALQS